VLICSPGSRRKSLYNGSDFKLDLGIRVQLQYYRLGDEGWSEEKLYFRRLRPALEATFSPSWEAEAEFDFGETIEGKGPVKDLFVSYHGLSSKGVFISLGNDKAVFSRQLQSSSKSLTLVERGFVGIDDFGSLDRVLGARADARDATGRFAAAGSVGLAAHKPDPSQMEFSHSTPVGTRIEDGRCQAASSSPPGKSPTTRETLEGSASATRFPPPPTGGATTVRHRRIRSIWLAPMASS
jgi:hypothetical protein